MLNKSVSSSQGICLIHRSLLHCLHGRGGNRGVLLNNKLSAVLEMSDLPGILRAGSKGDFFVRIYIYIYLCAKLSIFESFPFLPATNKT